MTVQDNAAILAAARDLSRRHETAYTRRGAALLARQALEGALDHHWRRRAPGTEHASTRTQLACLPSHLSDDDLARRVGYTWWALTRACHHHPYELPIGADELDDLFGAVERMIAASTAGE